MLEIKTVTFVKIKRREVYDRKIFEPCAIHAQKFKDRGPDFDLLFTEPGGTMIPGSLIFLRTRTVLVPSGSEKLV